MNLNLYMIEQLIIFKAISFALFSLVPKKNLLRHFFIEIDIRI